MGKKGKKKENTKWKRRKKKYKMIVQDISAFQPWKHYKMWKCHLELQNFEATAVTVLAVCCIGLSVIEHYEQRAVWKISKTSSRLVGEEIAFKVNSILLWRTFCMNVAKTILYIWPLLVTKTIYGVKTKVVEILDIWGLKFKRQWWKGFKWCKLSFDYQGITLEGGKIPKYLWPGCAFMSTLNLQRKFVAFFHAFP